MNVIKICEYTFQVRLYNGIYFVNVFDTSLNEYVGEFFSTEEVTQEKCETWLNEFYEF